MRLRHLNTQAYPERILAVAVFHLSQYRDFPLAMLCLHFLLTFVSNVAWIGSTIMNAINIMMAIAHKK